MEFTLDSVTHAIACLKEQQNIKELAHLPIIKDINELTVKNDNNYYFGVLSVGSNVDNVQMNLFNKNFIDVSTNSQIISLFDSISINKKSGITASAKGQFRGFVIYKL